jgi:asparaginyl-tRNA synthetase
VRIKGIWKESPGQGQSHELEADEVHVLGTSDIEASAREMVNCMADWSVASSQTYPIQKKYHTPEFLRTLPHLRIRTPFHSVLARFRSACLSFLGSYISRLDAKGRKFVQVQPPIITSSDCEGAGEVFTVVSNAAASAPEQGQSETTKPNAPSFFRTPKYLTVSSQLHLEAYAAELGHVWALSPTFRAEKSDTPRHLAEFYMLEVEMGYARSLQALTGSLEHIIRSLTASLVQSPHYADLLLATRASNEEGAEQKAEELEKRWDAIREEPWKSASYTYCMKKLEGAARLDRKLFERQPRFGSSLQLEHERWIVQNIGNDRPIFVTHYPKAIKPFYMAPSHLAYDHSGYKEYRYAQARDAEFHHKEKGKDTVACFDLLLPFGASEIAGGSLREHRLENLIENMREAGMLKPKTTTTPSPHQPHDDPPHPPKDSADDYPFLQPGESLGNMKWYADLRRYGTMPHGGYGLGFDRLIAYLTGVHNLRDVVAFPRTYGRADC